jgi:hypothetical protein
MANYENVESDMGIATESLKEEMEGVAYYKESLEVVACPELQKLIEAAHTDEQKHAAGFLKWINANAAAHGIRI